MHTSAWRSPARAGRRAGSDVLAYQYDTPPLRRAPLLIGWGMKAHFAAAVVPRQKPHQLGRLRGDRLAVVSSQPSERPDVEGAVAQLPGAGHEPVDGERAHQ